MITTLHTLSLASITHHTNSPRVQLRRPPRARPQLTRPPLPAPVLRRPPRPPELHQSARSPVLAARCPTIARHPSPGAPPTASAPPAVSSAAAHPATARRSVRRRPRAPRPTRMRLRRLPRARPQLTRTPLPAPVLRRPPRTSELCQSARPPVLAARCPTIACHAPLGAPPTTSATPERSLFGFGN